MEKKTTKPTTHNYEDQPKHFICWYIFIGALDINSETSTQHIQGASKMLNLLAHFLFVCLVVCILNLILSLRALTIFLQYAHTFGKFAFLAQLRSYFQCRFLFFYSVLFVCRILFYLHSDFNNRPDSKQVSSQLWFH